MSGLIPYVPNIPFATHNPSADQPNMEANNNAISQWTGVDHVPFNVNFSGTHSKMTFVNSQPTPALTASQAQIYPQTFGSGPTYLETYISSDTSASSQINGYLPFVKCMTSFLGIGITGPITPITNALNVNVATIANLVSGASSTITITFSTALPFNTYYLFLDQSTALIPVISYTRTTASIAILGVTGNFNGARFAFMVI